MEMFESIKTTKYVTNVPPIVKLETGALVFTFSAG
jgi:hypothetical protein